MKSAFPFLVTIAVAIGTSHAAVAATGPTMAPLKVTQVYTHHGSSAIYVAFQSGAMPNCYGNAGGYLFVSNTFFKELYSQVLSMVAMGGVKAAVVYTLNAQAGQWSDCTIDGLHLVPE